MNPIPPNTQTDDVPANDARRIRDALEDPKIRATTIVTRNVPTSGPGTLWTIRRAQALDESSWWWVAVAGDGRMVSGPAHALAVVSP